jgi:2-polyprenyl-6-methoxyphenol hydroxylase-like FAD-dependent oxidoreductase
MSKAYDAIVVGARCAGSPTAMLLARKGYRALVVDRATFPSDTVSTHVLHPMAVAALAGWGLHDRLVATACPPMHTYAFDFGPFTISGAAASSRAPASSSGPMAGTPWWPPQFGLLSPEFAERLRGAKREARFAGAAVPNFFRKPYGPGWALLGDAAYNPVRCSSRALTPA